MSGFPKFLFFRNISQYISFIVFFSNHSKYLISDIEILKTPSSAKLNSHEKSKIQRPWKLIYAKVNPFEVVWWKINVESVTKNL